jgi:peptide/nickel transport system permease protein
MRRLTPEARRELEHLYHLDQPLHRQYLLWLSDALRGDLGRSFHDRKPVLQKIGERLGITLTLNALALGAMILISVPLGAAAALQPGSRWDRYTAVGSYLLYALPVFWAGLLLQILFSVRLGWLPLYGLASTDAGPGWAALALDRAAHLVLPVLCLSYGGVAYLSRFVRATLLDNAAVEGSRAARARGLSSWAVICRHGFRQAAVPLLTLAGFLLPALVGGSVIVETIFAIPGLGRLFVDATFQRDLPVLMGLTLLSGTATLAGVVLADLAYAWVDPRVRRE